MKAISVFKSVAWAIIIVVVVAFGLICFSLLSGCSFHMSIESTKKPTVIEVVREKPPVKSVQPKKSNYDRIKEDLNKQHWLNQPHDPIDSRFFLTDSNYKADNTKWHREVYYQSK
jgi:hypothetical protein